VSESEFQKVSREMSETLAVLEAWRAPAHPRRHSETLVLYSRIEQLGARLLVMQYTGAGRVVQAAARVFREGAWSDEHAVQWLLTEHAFEILKEAAGWLADRGD
jgi:hypothetical protein